MGIEIKTEFVQISTKGHSDIVDITHHINEILANSGLDEGQVTVFATGATAAVTTIEYEPGLVKDIPEALERIAPERAHYHHNDTWGDGNGNSHVRSALIGASLTVPFVSARLLLGTWQHIVFVDCDNRARQRKIPVQMIGK